MGKHIFCNLLILIFLSPFTTVPSDKEGPWKLKTEKNGITIYNRSVDYSKIKELKMITTVKSNLGALVKILDDVTRYPEWMYGCKSGEKITLENSSLTYDRATLQFPKPFSYREMFTRSTFHQDSVTKVVTLKTASISEDVHRDKNLVLIKDMATTWVLTPLPSGEVEIESYLFCDPGGYIPAFLLNALMDRGPIRTLQNLRKHLEKPEFQNVSLAGIRD